MTILSYAAILALVQAVGVPPDQQPIAVAIALAESGGDTQIVNTAGNSPPSRDRGLWQINSYWHQEVTDECAFDAMCSTLAMYRISNSGTSWGAWSAYKNGSYLRFLQPLGDTPPMSRSEYCTQLDQSANGHDRCWAAALASAMLHFGWQSDPWGLTLQVWTDAGAVDKTVDSDGLIALASKYGLPAQKWVTRDEAGVALSQDKVVLCLLDNRYLVPHAYPHLPGWDAQHWIRLVAQIDGNETHYVYDPLTYALEPGVAQPYQGPWCYSAESVWQAIRMSPAYEAGIIVSRPGSA